MFLADSAYPGPPPDAGRSDHSLALPQHDARRHLGMHVFFGMDNDLAQAYAINMDAM